MIISSIELTGNEPTYAELEQRIAEGEFDDVVASRAFLILTTDAGLVKVNRDKTIMKNVAIQISSITDDLVSNEQLAAIKEEILQELTSAIQLHESTYHTTT